MLIYIGKGAYLPNIPARDLTSEEVSRFGKKLLLDSGLYAEPSTPKTKASNKESEL